MKGQLGGGGVQGPAPTAVIGVSSRQGRGGGRRGGRVGKHEWEDVRGKRQMKRRREGDPGDGVLQHPLAACHGSHVSFVWSYMGDQEEGQEWKVGAERVEGRRVTGTSSH